MRVVIEKSRTKREDISIKDDRDDDEFNQERGSRIEMGITNSQLVDVSKTDMRNEVLKHEIEKDERSRNSIKQLPSKSDGSEPSDADAGNNRPRASHVVK